MTDIGADVATAKRLGLEFNVTVKTAPGKPWADKLVEVDLKTAWEGRNSDAYETAIFLLGRPGDYLYWTSRFPEVLNSDALEARNHGD